MNGAFIATHNVLALDNQLDKIRTLQPCINKYRLDELGKNLRIKERTTSSYCTVEMLLKSLFRHIFLENEKLVNDEHNLWYHAHVLINNYL